MLELRLPVALQHEVVLERIVQHQSVFVPVLRDVAHAELAALADRGACDVVPLQPDRAGARTFQPGQRVDELRLAVPLYAGQADDFAAPHGKGGVFHGVVVVEFAGHGHTFDAQHLFAGRPVFLVYLEFHIAADHHARQLLFGGGLDVHRADAAALAQHRAAVGDGHDLVQLVRDEQDGLALACEVAHDLHELFNFLRRQHGGGFVKNQNFIVAVEHLQDFDALLHADGDVLDPGVRIDRKAVFFRKRDDTLPRFLFLEESGLVRFDAEDDVVQHGKDLNELEMLVHHADVQRIGVVGVLDLDHLAVFFDRSRFRLIETEQDAHERGFARAVLAEQRMHLSPPQLQRNVVVGLDAGEFLCDVQHFYDVVAHETRIPSLLK